MHFIALGRGCSESKLAFPGFGTALLLLRSDFSSSTAETSSMCSSQQQLAYHLLAIATEKRIKLGKKRFLV